MHSILASILSGTWFIDEQSAQGYLPVAAAFLKGEHNPHIQNLSENREKHKAYLLANGKPRRVLDIEMAEELPENSIAVIPVHGVVTNDDQFSGPSGTKTKTQILDKLEGNPNVVGVIFDFDTPGGEAMGTRQFAKRIAGLSKPNVAFVRNMCASAGIWIASACDHIILEDDLTRIGSIGGYLTIADQTRYFENQGIDITKVYAKQSTKKNRTVTRDNDTTYEKQDISELTQVFIDDVNKWRGDKLADDPDIFAGEVYWAPKAIEIGLADEMGSFADAVTYLNGNAQSTNNNLSNTNQTSENMKIKDTWKTIKAFFGSEKEELKEDDVEQLNTELGNKEEQISNLTSEKKQLEDDKKALEDEKKKLEDDKKSLEEEKTKLENEKAEAEKKLAEMPGESTAKVTKEADEGGETKDDIPDDPADEAVKEEW